jgi:hypothetical protein
MALMLERWRRQEVHMGAKGRAAIQIREGNERELGFWLG